MYGKLEDFLMHFFIY